ncbi:fibrous sheath CABYR-binding protein-like [Teleopsis dalmanni]|uniref:fibrous sheath CABYR-binding protein-like n=1 Tax=Teleopsis dalmanni TaxID=139649 RepID=UPI0018CDE1B0|nr:fibrous sheath CABYR-binding protein-like [Teleopsis dalmanni]
MNKMYKQLLTLTLLFVATFADVSHLSNHYLPPAPLDTAESQPNFSTVIEQHELKELPEQVEYVQENDAQQVPPIDMQPPPFVATPAAHYLPPPLAIAPLEKVKTAEEVQVPEMSEIVEEEQVTSTTTTEQPIAESTTAATTQEVYTTTEAIMTTANVASESTTPTVEYLPPQPNYQQYQEQLELSGKMPEEILLSQEPQEIVEIVAEEAPLETPVPKVAEPEPAHYLAADGYHYKTGGTDKRFRLRH